MWQYSCVQILFLQHILFLNHTSLIPFHFYSPLKYLGNNKRDRFNWRNLFTFFSRYIDDKVINKFWYIGKAFCPTLFAQWIITIIFTIFKTLHSFLGLKWSQEYWYWYIPASYFWTVVLEKTLESPLDSKEIQPVHPKGDQSWIFIGRTDAGAETLILWPPDVKNWLTGKDPDAGNNWRCEEKGTPEDEMLGWHHRLNGHEFE